MIRAGWRSDGISERSALRMRKRRARERAQCKLLRQTIYKLTARCNNVLSVVHEEHLQVKSGLSREKSLPNERVRVQRP